MNKRGKDKTEPRYLRIGAVVFLLILILGIALILTVMQRRHGQVHRQKKKRKKQRLSLKNTLKQQEKQQRLLLFIRERPTKQKN